MKNRLQNIITKILRDRGYRVSECSGIRSCFDVIARKDQIFLIKVLTNVESLNNKSATELKQVSAIIDATPLIVADRKKNAPLKQGVVYARYGINVLNPWTFEQMLSDHFPVIYAIRGNYCMKIKPSLLTRMRKKMDSTQEELASELGISKQSVHRYENTGRISLDVARKLIDIFEKEIELSQDIFESELSTSLKEEDIKRLMQHAQSTLNLTILKQMVIDELKNIGLKTFPTNAPFDVIAQEQKGEERILSVVSNDSRTLEKKVEISKKITSITGDYSICVSQKKQELEIPVIDPDELSELSDSKELIKYISRW